MDQAMMNLERPLAIHDAKGSFSDAWVAYCITHKIPYVLVDCYDSDIVETVANCSGLLWHWSHNDASAANFARSLIYSLEAKGIPVFPNSRTCWHFDDKLGQKYLFEALDIPHVPSHAFYRKDKALDFVNQSDLPLVFKLKRGAGSKNVALVSRRSRARKMVRRSFHRGWQERNRSYALSERLWQFRRDKSPASAVNILKGLARYLRPHPVHRIRRLESAYSYFQDFIPNNDSDIRVIVIDDKAIGIKRLVRTGDFRASGSGTIIYDPTSIPADCIEIAFESSAKIGMQSAAFDFVISNGAPLIVEVSYGFDAKAYEACPGYWDRDLQWHDAVISPEEMIIDQFLMEIQSTAS